MIAEIKRMSLRSSFMSHPILQTMKLRPPSVYSLHGGATDVFTKAPIEKKSRKLRAIPFFNFRPTDWTDLARHKSAMQGINRPWPKHAIVIPLSLTL